MMRRYILDFLFELILTTFLLEFKQSRQWSIYRDIIYYRTMGKVEFILSTSGMGSITIESKPGDRIGLDKSGFYSDFTLKTRLFGYSDCIQMTTRILYQQLNRSHF